MLDKTWNHTTGNVVYWVGPGIPSHACIHSMLWGGGGGGSLLKSRRGGQGFSAYISTQVFIKTYQDYQYSEITQTLKV